MTLFGKRYTHHCDQWDHIGDHEPGWELLLNCRKRSDRFSDSREPKRSLQDTIRSKADINRRQMDIFALVLRCIVRFQRIDLKVGGWDSVSRWKEKILTFMNISSYVCCTYWCQCVCWLGLRSGFAPACDGYLTASTLRRDLYETVFQF